MRVPITISVLVAVSASLAGCGSNASDNASANRPAGSVCAETKAAGDQLAEVCKAGKIKVVAFPEFDPVSFVDKETGKWGGFDIGVDEEIAHRLGVDIEYVTPSYDVVVAGNWAGRWDMGGGSMTVTPDRQKVLNITEPYYYSPAVALVHKDNTSVQDPYKDLDGATIGTGTGTTYEQYLNKKLNIAGLSGQYIDNVTVRGYDLPSTALQDLSLGDGVRLKAALIDELSAQKEIAAGKPLKIVGKPLFNEPIGVGFDKSSPSDSTSLYEAVNKIIADMHQDGTLSTLSKKWFDGLDLTVKK